MKRIKTKSIFGALCLFFAISIFSLFSINSTSAAGTPSTLSLSINTNNLLVDLMPTEAGTFGTSNDATISVTTNNFTGYTLKIASVNGTDLVNNTSGISDTISSLGSAVSASSFSSSSTYNNKWGYKPSQYITTTGGTNTKVINSNTYLPSPTATGDLLDITDAANNTAKTYTINIGARVDTTLASGVYSNNFIIYAVSNTITYNIHYNNNTTDTVTNMPSPNPQVVDIVGGTAASQSYATLSNSSPSRTGFTFAGWCDTTTTEDTTTHSQTCPGNTIAAGGRLDLDQTSDPDLNLYAIWTAKNYTVTFTLPTGAESIVLKKNNQAVCTITSNSANTCSLTYNVPYDITITPSAGYNFNNWSSPANSHIANNTAATTVYTPGAGAETIAPTMTAIDYTITLRAGNGISTLTLSGWTGSGTDTLTKTYHIGDTINLATPTKAYKTGYSGTKYIKNDNVGTLSSATYTVGAGNGDITISATSLDTPVCTIKGGATKVYNRSATTLTATDNSANYDSGVNITYSFGYATNGTNTLGNFGAAQAGNTTSIGAAAYRGGRYYGVKVTVTDPNDSTITNTCTSSTVDAAVTGDTVANRTTMTLVNSRINFDATTNGGTLTGTTPLYVQYGSSESQFFTGRTNDTAGTLPTANAPTGYSFAGWYNSGNTKVINANGTLTGTAVSGWTNAAKQWVKTGTSTSATSTANTLYAQYTANTYNITLDRNCSTTAAGSTSTTATYDATTLAAITVPTCSNATGTRAVSGFTKTNSAANSTVSSTATINSTNTTTYTFNGWHITNGTGTLIADTNATPNLAASVTDYTNSSKQWKRTSGATFYAGWNTSSSSYSSITLPTITRTGSTCGWSTSSSATTITYASGSSLTPTANTTLYGVCVTNITLNKNGATNSPTTSTTVNYNATTLGALATLPTRSYTVSGWTLPSSNNANGATVNGGTAPGTLTATYTFDGWHASSGTGTLIASKDSTPALQASTTYTNSSKQWTYTTAGAITLYAGWTGGSITLPTITKTGYTCGWTTTATNATTITYASGASLTPTANTTLYGVCTIKNNLSLKVSFNSTYVSSIKVCKTSGNCSGSDLMGTVTTSGNSVSGLTYGVAYYLYPTYTTGSVLNSWAKDSGAVGTLSSTSAANPTYTIGDGTNAVTHSGKYDTYTITLNRNCSTTATGSQSATVTYLATSLSSITVPTCSNATSTRTVSGFTKTNSANNSTISSTTTLNSTQTTTYTFNGWHLTNGTGTLIASSASTPALQQVSGYTNASKQWTKTSGETFYAGWNASTGNYTSVTLPTITRTGSTCGWSTSSSATTISYASGASFTPTANTTLYGVCVTNLTLNANGGTGGTTSAQVIYNDTKITANNGGTSEGGNITNPTRSDTYTVSGFTKTTSANNSTVSSTTTLNSVRPYTFNGWYKETGATTQIASNAVKPALTASNGYTNSSKQWTYTTAGNITLYAGWTAGSFAAVTLPTITRTGSTCGWSTSSSATTITYASGASFTPTGNTTLYGVCVNNITINKSNCPTTAGGASSATVNYNATSLNSFTAPTCSNGTASRTVSGFTKTTSATNSTVSATTTLTSSATTTYTYAGLYQQSGLTTLVANTSRALQASTTYTDANSKWTYTTASAVTLYAKFNSSTGNYSAVTLPTITRTGSTCGWSTSSTATTISYASGASFTPTANTTLYGVCVTNITLNKNGATNTPTTSTTVNYNATTLNSIATLPTRSNTTDTRTVSGWTLPSSNNADGATVNGDTAPGTLNSTATVTHTFNGWHASSGTGTLIASKDSTPALQASTTYTNSSKQWTYTTAGNITLYAGWDDSTGSFSAVTLPTITKTGYNCGWTTTATNATTITYASGASLTPTANTTLYGVCTIKNNLSLKISFNSTYVSSIAVKTGSASGTTVGTVSTSGNSVTGLTYGTAYYLVPTYTTGSVLNSWAKDSGAVGTLSSTSAANPTYTIGDGTNAVTHSGKYNTYTITLNRNCATTATGSTSATATYYSTTLATITVPTCSNGTSTRTVSGFSIPVGNNANGATVSSTSSLNSTAAITYTFNGWHINSGTGTLVASTAATPALQASVSGYTDSANRWTKTGAATLYAGWNSSTGSYSSVTLPTITKTGYTCGWTTTSNNATTITYSSGVSMTPTSATTTLYGVCKCPANKICYNTNAASGVVGTMGQQSITSTATSATLIASNFSRSNYGYAGWNTKSDGTGTNYGPQQTISFTAGQYSSTGLTLYAKWIASAGNIQNWTGCSSLASGAVTALKDQRDNQVYAVAKLADGKCWMIENLRIEAANTIGTTNKGYSQGYGTSSTYGSFSGLATAESANFTLTDPPVANSKYSVDGSNGTTNINSADRPYTRMPRYNNSNTQSRASNPTSNSVNLYSYGNYYTWPAAIADTAFYETRNQNVSTTSLCPTGWRLPKGGEKSVISNNEFWTLIVTGVNNGVNPANYSSSSQYFPYYDDTEAGPVANKLRSYPNNFIYAGHFYQSSVDDKGTASFFWSSTVGNHTSTYRLDLEDTHISPGTYSNFKGFGFSVRCIKN